MSLQRALVDTDILSAIMRQEPQAVRLAQQYLAEHTSLTISIITRYEILRGLKAKHATVQLAAFQSFCSAIEVVSLSEEIVEEAADIYANLHRRGKLIGDADILIAATARINQWQIVTNNTSHFTRIEELVVCNWLTA